MSQRSSDAYSPIKATRHLPVIEAVREGRPIAPPHVQLILSDTCNHSCSFCAYRDPGYSSSQLFYQIRPGPGGLRRDGDHPERDYNPRRLIPWAKVQEVLEDCQDMGVRAIQFTGGGEPTVHPNWLDAIVDADRRGLDTALVTNGVLLQKPEQAELVALLKWLRVSLDAGQASTYSKIRGCPESHFDAALDAITFARTSRDRLGTDTVLGVGFVVTPDNWGEVVNAASLAKDAGADNFRISAQFSAEDERLFAGFWEQAADLCRQAERLGDNSFQVFNRFGAKLDDLRLGRPDYDRCGYQYFTTYIGGDLNVYRCCVQSYNEQGLLGSIKDQRFRDLWMSQSRVEGMDRFSARSCERCQFNGINRTLDYVLRPEDPAHSNFV